jgi:hypothetical protein
MRHHHVLFSIVGLCVLGLVGNAGCGKKKLAENALCKEHKDCKDGLKCVNRHCTDFSGSHPACKWSLECLKKLSEKLPKEGTGYEITRFYKTLSGAPYRNDCIDMPQRIAALLYNKPWEWKGICGPPPVDGVKVAEDKSNPFEIIEKKVKESNIPGDEKPELHQKHTAYPDICKAWVKFKLRRNFQGWVVARITENYNCQALTDEEKKKLETEDQRLLAQKCEKRPYAQDDRRYIPLSPRDAEFSMNFYFSTPPEVCKKPNISEKEYKTGCFCLGIDKSKFDLEFVEDPFLFLDEMQKPKAVKNE